MGFALLSGTALIAPLAGWIARRAALYAIPGGSAPQAAPAATARPVAAATRPASRRLPAAVAPASVRPLRAVPPVAGKAATATARPLRMLHIVDGAPQAGTSRLRLSGRMADVCAELDRLAAREAQLAARGLRAGC